MKIQKISIIIDKKIFNENNLDFYDDNINGPSLIKVPKFIKKPLGQYYLYFGHHKGKYIRMAYSNNITGPYTLYENGVLHLDNIPGYNHLASPDVHIENEKICMFYHCPYKNGKTPQSTFYAYSNDGLNFISETENIIHPYFRKFSFKNDIYGLAMKTINCNTITPELERENCKSVTVVFKKTNNIWNEIAEILPFSRHSCIFIINSTIYVFFSNIGDNPEHIKVGELIINQKNNICNIINIKSIIKPELYYEHHNTPLIKSEIGRAKDYVRQLRDPYVFKDENDIYILYSVCGEKGIAIAKINFD